MPGPERWWWDEERSEWDGGGGGGSPTFDLSLFSRVSGVSLVVEVTPSAGLVPVVQAVGDVGRLANGRAQERSVCPVFMQSWQSALLLTR